MNGLGLNNVIIYKSLKKQINKCSDRDFKKVNEIENDNMSLLVVEGFFHDSWWMKYKRPRLLVYLTLLIESGYVTRHNYFICLNDEKFR